MEIQASIGSLIRRGWYAVMDRAIYGSKNGVCGQLRDIRFTLRSYKTGRPLVERMLSDCLREATENSVFYRPYANQPLSAFPILNKLDFIARHDEITSVRYRPEDLHVMSTSGSTGTPFKVLQDRVKRNRVLAELKYFGECSGYRSHEKMIFFRACHPVPFWKMFWSNVWTLDIASMSDEKAMELYREQKKGCLRAILAYASTYDILTRKWLVKGLKGSKNVRAVITGSEILRDEVRERCQRFWPKAQVYSRYSNQENGIIAQEKGRPNEYEINWASYYVEILKLDSDEMAADGEVGRIIITDMFNRAFPMIRYDTGDLGAMRHRENDWPVLCSVEGRRVDLIFATDGSNVSPHTITNVFWGVKGISQWQFIQESPSRYRVKYIVDTDPATARSSLKERIQRLKSILGQDAVFVLDAVDAIPLTSSKKFKMIVQQMLGTVV